MRIRLAILKLIRPFTRLVIRINFRIGAPPLTGEMYQRIIELAQPGDLILTRTAHRPTNLVIPGRWGHVQILVGDMKGSTIEATVPLVRESNLVDVWTNASEVKLVRPRWADSTQRAKAVRAARRFIGLPYDYYFELTDRAFYCSELAIRSYAEAGSNAPIDIYQIVGDRSVVIPSKLEDDKHFETIWHSEEHS